MKLFSVLISVQITVCAFHTLFTSYFTTYYMYSNAVSVLGQSGFSKVQNTSRVKIFNLKIVYNQLYIYIYIYIYINRVIKYEPNTQMFSMLIKFELF